VHHKISAVTDGQTTYGRNSVTDVTYVPRVEK